MQFYIEKLPLIVYGIALFLWIPILLLSGLKQLKIGRITPVAIISSILALIYEGYMTFVWAPTVIAPIRVDAAPKDGRVNAGPVGFLKDKLCVI